MPCCIISHWAGEQTSAWCHLLQGEFWLLKHFQLMPFLIMKNKENAPGLVQLYVPLSAAPVLWFLLPLSFTSSLAVIALCSQLSPWVALGRPPCPALLLWLVQPCPSALTLLYYCSSRLGSSKPVSSVVLLLPTVCPSRGSCGSSPSSGIFPCGAALQGKLHSPLDELKPLSLHWNMFFLFNDIPITC